MKPFLKWAGGKYRLVWRIREQLPAGKRLLEPFAGSCSLALNTDYSDYWLNDINRDLVALYQAVQQEGPNFVTFCKTYFTPDHNTKERYYELRQQFNRERDPYVRAALFVYLNRHGYNGLCRYNSKGVFNVPFGRYRKPRFPERELLFFHQKFKNARFTAVDFETVMLGAEKGDVIYCDPPYLPLNKTANFTTYSTGGFNTEKQLRLAEIALQLAEQGIKTVISNHQHQMISDVYQGARIETFTVQRLISCDGENRNRVEEVLAVFG